MNVKKIRYLLEERGRFYYQRKVPKALTHAMKMDRWHLPVGDDYETATDRVKELKKEHDALIKQVKADPSYLITLRREGEARLQSKQASKAQPFQEFMNSVRSGEIDCYEAQVELAFQDALAAEAEPGWKTTKDVLHDLQELRKPHVDLDFGKTRKKGAGPVSLEEYQAAAACYAGIAPLEYFDKWQDLLVGSESGFEFREVAPITDDEFSDRLSEHLSDNFSAASAPTDEDERLEFDMLKMKLERLIARFSPTPDKLSSVFERFLTFSDIKTEPKYRRVFKQFVRFAGDIPISQVTTTTLREYRDELLAKDLELASVKAAFTPLKSLFRYAQNEEIVDTKVEVDDANFQIPIRDKRTRAIRYQELDTDLDYTGKELDRSVVAPNQIRTVLEAYKNRVFTELFPDRTGEWLPKTLIFAKDDNHAEEIVHAVREVFGEGNDFAKKITYRNTGEKPKELIKAFRVDPFPRVAVTVDMIATGTDIKPVEVLIFMRDVKSEGYYEQMKGRGVRTIPDADLKAVTPDAQTKTRFVLIDAVGVST